MLINTNIKRIVGGGCEIKEVRYMDNVVWSGGKNITIDYVLGNTRSIPTLKINREIFKTKSFYKMTGQNLEIWVETIERAEYVYDAKYDREVLYKGRLTVSISINGRPVYNNEVTTSKENPNLIYINYNIASKDLKEGDIIRIYASTGLTR